MFLARCKDKEQCLRTQAYIAILPVSLIVIKILLLQRGGGGAAATALHYLLYLTSLYITLDYLLYLTLPASLSSLSLCLGSLPLSHTYSSYHTPTSETASNYLSTTPAGFSLKLAPSPSGFSSVTTTFCWPKMGRDYSCSYRGSSSSIRWRWSLSTCSFSSWFTEPYARLRSGCAAVELVAVNL